MSGLLVSLWIFSYVGIQYRSSYVRFVGITVDIFLCRNILQVLLRAVCQHHCGCFPMYEYIAGPPMSGLSTSLWMFSFV